MGDVRRLLKKLEHQCSADLAEDSIVFPWVVYWAAGPVVGRCSFTAASCVRSWSLPPAGYVWLGEAGLACHTRLSDLVEGQLHGVAAHALARIESNIKLVSAMRGLPR